MPLIRRGIKRLPASDRQPGTKKMKKKHIFILTAVLVIFSHSVSADSHLMKIKHEGGQSYFEITAVPGSNGAIEFDVNNDSGKELTNFILLYDSLTAVNGGNEIMSPEEIHFSETAGWFSDNITEITLPNGGLEHKKLGFKVPEDTEPGIYTAILGIYSSADAIQADSGKDDGISLNINNYYTTTMAVVISIGTAPEGNVLFGETAEIKVDAKKGIAYLYIPVRNVGNTYEFPIINASLSGNSGKLLFEGENKMAIVYRNTDTFACFSLAGCITGEGDYRVECDMTASENGRFMEQSKVFDINLGNEKVREALINQLENESSSDPDWSGGYFILGKKQLLFGFAASVILIFTVCSFIFFFRKLKRKRETLRAHSFD